MDQISPNKKYVDTLLMEAKKRRNLIPYKKLNSIYFGGGTPSLLSGEEIKRIVDGIKKLDFEFSDDIEITIEVNPATLTNEKCKIFKDAGVNRLSVGSQTFDDKLLKACNREHNSQDTLNTVNMLKKYFDNFSLDLLFSLPNQDFLGLERDLKILNSLAPPHVSAYCLTLNDKHPMNQGRCSEDEQVAMFAMIKDSLAQLNLNQYEISNYSKKGLESVHNSIYWTDHSYWGIGLSAHSYLNQPDWGYRFWNPSSYKTYMDNIENLEVLEKIPQSYGPSQMEKLKEWDSLTDFCHTHLRLSSGLDKTSLRQKFGDQRLTQVSSKMDGLGSQQWTEETSNGWRLTEQGVLLSNQVFAKLLFSDSIDRA